MANQDVSFYVDCMIIEAFADDGKLSKTAEGDSLVLSLLGKVKDYVMAHIDHSNKAESIINILGPGVIAMTLRAMGLGWVGMLISFALKMFGIEIGPIVTSIWDKLKSSITGDKQTTPAQIDSAVSSAVQENVKPATAEEAQQYLESRNYSQELKDARFIKLALIEYERQSLSLTKEAKGITDFLPGFNSRKSATASILSRVLSWIFKVALASAGLMVMTDFFKKMIGQPNALDGNLKDNKPVGSSSAPISASKQTKFPLNPSYNNRAYSDVWQIPIRNTPSDIENLLVGFAKEVYQGLNDFDSEIRSSPAFQLIKNQIVQYNIASPGDNMVFMPKGFTTKKQIVDLFIDDVAQKAP